MSTYYTFSPHDVDKIIRENFILNKNFIYLASSNQGCIRIQPKRRLLLLIWSPNHTF